MTKKEIINLYKKDRSIADDYKLDGDENYFVDKLYEAINFTPCCDKLKDKEVMTFWEWAAHNKLETKDDEVLYNEIWYYLPDLVRKYEREIKNNL